MKLNMHILYDELRGYSCNSSLNNDIIFVLAGVRMFPLSASLLTSEYVYVCTPSQLLQISTVHFSQTLHFICTGEVTLNNNNFEIIYLKGKSKPEELLETIQDIFEEYNDWDEELAEAAFQKNNYQRLLDIGARHLWNPIALTDLSWYDLARSGQFINSADTWGSLTTGFAALERSSDQDLLITNKMLHSNTMPFFVPIGLVNAQYLQAPIHSANTLVGLLKTNDMNQPITAGQYSLIRHLQIWIERATAVTPIPIPMSEEDVAYADLLLDHLPIDQDEIKKRLGFRNWKIDDEYQLFLCELTSGSNIGEQRSRSYCVQLKGICPNSIIFVKEPYFIVLVHGTATGYAEIKTKLDFFLKKTNMKAGASTLFNNYAKLASAFSQAKAALLLSKPNADSSSIFEINHCYADFLMNIIDNSLGLDSICHSRLLNYALCGGQRELDHIRSLKKYLLLGRNSSAAAAALFIHRNTLHNHLMHLQRAAQIDVENIPDDDVLRLLLTCLAAEYLTDKNHTTNN